MQYKNINTEFVAEPQIQNKVVTLCNKNLIRIRLHMLTACA